MLHEYGAESATERRRLCVLPARRIESSARHYVIPVPARRSQVFMGAEVK